MARGLLGLAAFLLTAAAVSDRLPIPVMAPLRLIAPLLAHFEAAASTLTAALDAHS
jgi:hypothetical protein